MQCEYTNFDLTLNDGIVQRTWKLFVVDDMRYTRVCGELHDMEFKAEVRSLIFEMVEQDR